MTNQRSSKRRSTLAVLGYPRAVLAVLAALGAAWLPACQDRVDSASKALDEQSRRGFIAFIGAGPDDAIWPVLKAGAERYVATGTALDVRFLLPASGAPAAQSELLNGLRDPEMRGVCIHIKDVETTTPALKSLQIRGVPIVSMVEPAPINARIGYVGVDEAQAGTQLARCAGESLGEQGGTVMVLHAGIDHPVYGSRYLGFSEQIKLESRIAVLREFNCHADPREARRIIEDVSARFPRLTAWIAIEDWPLAEGYPAKKLFPPGVRYITFGGLPRQWPLIQSGLCPCVLGADYSVIGGHALQFCQSAVRDPGEQQQIFHIPLRPITIGTLDQYQKDWKRWTETTPN